MSILERWHAHLVRAWRMGQKDHAERRAAYLAQLAPDFLATLPDLLKKTMQEDHDNRPRQSPRSTPREAVRAAPHAPPKPAPRPLPRAWR